MITDSFGAAASGRAASSAAMSDVERRRRAQVQQKFEGAALQVLVGSMLPQGESKMFGSGAAGHMWRGLLAEKLADVVSASGAVRLLPKDAFERSLAKPGSPAAAEWTASITTGEQA